MTDPPDPPAEPVDVSGTVQNESYVLVASRTGSPQAPAPPAPRLVLLSR